MPVFNAFQPTCGWSCGTGLGYVDAFVTRFNANGMGLTYSTFLGGSSADYGIGVTVDISGTPYITGDTFSTDYLVVNPYDSSQAGGYDTFISKIDNSSDAANLSVTITGTPDPVHVNTSLTYTITLTNVGPNLATGLRLIDTLPAGVNFVSATPSQGSCQLVATTAVSCSLNNLGLATQMMVTITIIPPLLGTITNTASVMSNLSDPDNANNMDTVTNTIVPNLTYLPFISRK
jgi:uncharacterized repeat protein (TIGR01451 family)